MKIKVVANWKMYGSLETCNDFITAFKGHRDKFCALNLELIICPPFLYIDRMLCNIRQYGLGDFIAVGAQDCSIISDFGPYTGDISANMLKKIGCSYCIVGHSEKRNNHNEKEQSVIEKALNIKQNDIIPIICIGEPNEDERAINHIENQIQLLAENNLHENCIIAYEPIWAIGTGKIPSIDHINKIAELIHSTLPKTQIIYGGSVNIDSIQNILSISKLTGVIIGKVSSDVNKLLEITELIKI